MSTVISKETCERCYAGLTGRLTKIEYVMYTILCGVAINLFK